MLASTKILIVDDEDMIREILADEFAEVVDHVYQAANGKEALEILEKIPDIDAIFSDISMPHMDGLELLTEVMKSYPKIAAVILSAYGDKKNTQLALEMGAMEFIDKPFQVSNLQKVAIRALDQAKINRKIFSEIEQLIIDLKIAEKDREEFIKSKRDLLLLDHKKSAL